MAKQFSVFVNIAGRVGSTFTNAIATVETKLNSLSRRFQASALAAKTAMKQIGDSMRGIAGLAAAGGLSFGIKHALGDGAELAHEIQALKNAGRTVGEVSEAIAEANKTIGKLPTTTLAENLKVLNETTGAFGDWHHALENLEFNQRIGSILQNSIGSKAGDPGEMFNSLVRAFEIRGTAADHHVYQKEVGELSRAMIFSRGNVNPHEVLNFAQQANPAIKNYSERFLTKIAPSLIQEFGGERAGTRAGAWYNAIMGKTRDKRMADAWVNLGLLDQSKVLKNKKTDEIIGWNPGAMKGTDEALADPLAWTEKYLVPALQKHGINTDDQMSVTKELGKLFRNSEANRFANAITQLRDRKRLHKDEGLINQVPDPEKAYDDTLLNDPKFAKLAASSALKNIGQSLTVILMPAIARTLTGIARALTSVAQAFTSNPNLAKAVAAVSVALAAMSAVKIAGFILGVTGLGRALMFLALAAPLGLAGRLLGVARGLGALAAATALGAAARIRTLVTALAILTTAGGARIVLASIAASFLALGRAMLLLPLTLLRGAFVGLAAMLSPIGVAIVAVTAALTALGLWVYSNASGIGTFFTSFGSAFMKALGPQTAGHVETVVSWLGKAWDWLSKLLGPIDETGKKWASWGESAGKGAAAVVNALADLPAKIGALAKQGYEAVANFDWASAGKAIIDGIVSGVVAAAGSLTAALTGAVSAAWNKAKAAVGFGGAPSAPGAAPAAPATSSAPAIAGARARGGPVTDGLPYLVGEKGPEIFVPNGSGRIETNGTLNALSRGGAAARGGLAVPVDSSAIERAGEVARRSGAVIDAALDKTVKPIVDTASIDAATAKAERLKAILAGLGGDAIKIGEGAAASAGASAGSSLAAGAPTGGAPSRRVVGGAPAKAGPPPAKAGGGPADASGGKSFGARADLTAGAKESYDFWREKGLSHAAAAGFAGSEQGENNFKAHGYGDRGAAYGSMMWQGPRRRQILAGTGVNVIGATHRQQLEAAHWEMTKGPDAGARKAWALAQGAKTPGEAAAIHVDHYERPLDRALNKRVRGGYANAWAKKFEGSAPPSPDATGKPPVALAGARALGGPVQNGLSYLVGEKGPEIFTPGASGGISTNATLNRLADVGSRTVPAEDGGTSPSIAPSPASVARLRPQGGNVSTRGDTSVHNEWHIHGANDPAHVQRQVETHFFDMVRRIESDQRGLLSD